MAPLVGDCREQIRAVYVGSLPLHFPAWSRRCRAPKGAPAPGSWFAPAGQETVLRHRTTPGAPAPCCIRPC